MGSVEPAPRPPSSSGSKSGWLIAAVAIAAGAFFWFGRSDERAISESPTEVSDSTESMGIPPSASVREEGLAKNRQIGELELRLKIAQQNNDAVERELAELQAALDASQASERRSRQGLDTAVDELNQLKEQLGRAEQQSSQRSSLESLLPTIKVGPLGPPQVLISQMGFVTVSGMVRNPTDSVSRGRLEISLVGSAGVIETRGFPMRVGPATTERYDITFPGIFPTERIAAHATWVE